MSVMSLYSEVIYKSRYARWLDDENRRENYEETVERYIQFFKKHLKKTLNYKMPPEDEAAVRASLNAQDTMSSMRAFMTAGPALESNEVASYNCLGGDTHILTKEFGSVPIKSVAGKTVTVLDGNGDWVEAPVREFGEQALHTITFRKTQAKTFRKDVQATQDHRWILNDGTVKTTSELLPGDVIPMVKPHTPALDDDYDKGVVHGLIYGDGTTVRHSNGRDPKSVRSVTRTLGYKIRVCGDAADLLPFFEKTESHIAYYPYMNGDPVVTLNNADTVVVDMKELPQETESLSYLLGFVRGWLAADGSVTKSNGQTTLCANAQGLEWITRYGSSLGLEVTGCTQLPPETNYGKRTRDTYSIRFARHSITAETLLIKRKADKLTPTCTENYVVVGVQDANKTEKVYCATVPTTASFVIEQNMLTGNCAYLPVDHVRAFSESMYILMSGTGVGFSVERRNIEKLPEIPEELHPTDTVVVVSDSRKGWCVALNQFLNLLYAGSIPSWDVSKIRPEGTRLKTFGGYASGPAVLEDLFRHIIKVFKEAQGRRLKPIEVFSVMTMIAQIVVVGGVRRSATICLFDSNDSEMRRSKSGQWWVANPHFAMANISAVYETRPDTIEFLEIWRDLVASGSGEAGIFNRKAVWDHLDKRGRATRDEAGKRIPFGVNPCAEIVLRPNQFCNLTGICARPEDDFAALAQKQEISAILGTWQSTVTDFDYLRKVWHTTTEEDRLLGCCLAGIMDHPLLKKTGPETVEAIKKLRDIAIEKNATLAAAMGIPKSAAVTAIKPAGNSGELMNVASGIHPRYAPYYVRTIRQSASDPVTQFLKDNGVPWEVSAQNARDVVFAFPLKSPDGALCAADQTAIQQLDHWLQFKTHYTDHTVSATIYVRNHEWVAVGAWVYENFDEITGLSFLPYDDHVYAQAPYTPITAEKYEELVKLMPETLDWSLLQHYEKSDTTTVSQDFACVGGACALT